MLAICRSYGAWFGFGDDYKDYAPTALGESVIKHVPFAVFGNENPKGIPASSPRLRRRSYLGLSSRKLANPNGVAANPFTLTINNQRHNPVGVDDVFRTHPG